jgi:hypothetical protein
MSSIYDQIVNIYNNLSPNVTYFTGKGEYVGDNGISNILPNNWNFKRGFLSPKQYNRSQKEIQKILKELKLGRVVNLYFQKDGIKVKVYEGCRFLYKTKIIFVSSNWLQTIFLTIKFRKIVLK